jgi:hypothetical protein
VPLFMHPLDQRCAVASTDTQKCSVSLYDCECLRCIGCQEAIPFFFASGFTTAQLVCSW